MKALNRHPSHIVGVQRALALTDVTGYGLLGHAYEMALRQASRSIEASAACLLPGALEYAERGILTGGAERNRKYLADKVRTISIPVPMEHVLFDPQTSGGLYSACRRTRA
jgi:selenide,water dikinase